MAWERRKLTPSFGMELSGQSLKPGLPLEEMKAVYDAVVESGVVVVKGQDLSDEDYANFAGSIGQIVPLPMIENLEQSHVSLFGNIDRERSQSAIERIEAIAAGVVQRPAPAN